MQIAVVVTLVLHVLFGVFWAGSTFTLARTGGAEAKSLYGPQMGAATIAVVTGAVLWFLAHRGPQGPTEHILGLGALCAVAAAGIQGIMCGKPLRLLATAGEAEAARLRARIATGQRIAAGLLAVAVICMAAARYA